MATDIYINIPEGGGGGSGVSSLNGQTGALTLLAGTNVTIVPGAGTLTINSTSSGSVTSVTASSPLASSGGTTPNITIQNTTTSQSGALTSTDWNTFNNKISTNRTINTSSPLAGGGDLSADRTLSIAQSTTSTNGYLSSTDWNIFNSKQSTLTIGNLTDIGTDGITVIGGTGAIIGSGTSISQQVATSSQNGYLAFTDWNTFNNKAPTVSPTFTGIPTAPTASVGTSTTQLATTAFVLSQGFQGATGSMPFAHQSSTSVVTSATTTFVTAITTTITVTATSAPVSVKATATLTTTTAASVANYRVTVNGVASQTQLVSLTAIATNYTAAMTYTSAALGPGTYTITFDIARSSGTGTVSFFEGSLDAIALQGTESNGITQLTGLGLSAGPGSGLQSLTGTLSLAGGGTNANLTPTNGGVVYSGASALAISAAGSTGQLLRSAGAASPTWTTTTFPITTTINQILYSSAANVISGLTTTNTGALVTSNTGVPSVVSGTTANRVLRTNGTTVSFAQVAAATDISGTLAMANGGTGTTSFANQRIPFSNGTVLTADALFLWDTVNTRLQVGGGGGTATANIVQGAGGTHAALNSYQYGSNNNIQAVSQNNNYDISMAKFSGTNTLGVLIGGQWGRGNIAAPAQSLNGDILMTLAAAGTLSTGVIANGFSAAIGFTATEDTTATANGADITFATTVNGTTNIIERVRIKNSGETQLTNSHLKSIQTTIPTIVANASAGTGASASLANTTDVAGQITITTGTIGLSTGSYATVTFNKTYNVAPIVMLTPASSTLSTSVYVTSTTTGFSINFAVAGGISSTYVLNYMCIETQ